MKNIILLIFLSSATFNCTSEFMEGTTFKDNSPIRHVTKPKFEIGKPLIFSNSVPIAKHLKIVSFYYSEMYFGKFIFGRLVGRTNEGTGNLETLFSEELQTKPSDGKVIIINNISIETVSTIPLTVLEFYPGFFYYLPYRGIAELAEVDAKELENYLLSDIVSPELTTTETKVPVKDTEKEKVILFKGIVHSFTETIVTVQTNRPDEAKPGRSMIFHNRIGTEVARGTVTNASFTNVKVKLNSGKVEKGFNAYIYEK